MEDEPGTFHLARLEALLNDGQWESARQGAKELIDTSLEGIRYLHTFALQLRPPSRLTIEADTTALCSFSWPS
jgi:hypothetical protein